MVKTAKSVLLLGCLWTLALPHASADTVKAATLPGYPPFGFYDTGAEEKTWHTVEPGDSYPDFRGYSWDVLREAFHAMDYTIELRVVPWARAMHDLEWETVELLYPAGRTEEREEYMTYSSEPVNAVNFLIYTEPGSDGITPGSDLEDLGGKRIAVARGWNFGDEWDDATNFEKEEVDSIEQGFAMLEAGRVDGFAGYEVVWDYHIAENDLGQYTKLPPFGVAREYVTTLTGNEKGEAMLEVFDEGKRRIEENGTMAEIESRWQ